MRKSALFVAVFCLALSPILAQAATQSKASDAKASASKASSSKASSAKAQAAKTRPIENGVIVKSAQANLLAKPQRGAARIEILGKFTPVKTIGKPGEAFTQVETLGGRKGYVESKDLAPNALVSVDSKKPVNIRSGPGANDTILFTLQNTYPLAVVDKKGSRLKVVDYDGDVGWVHENLVSPKPYVIVNLKSVNMRKSPGLDSAGKPTGAVLFMAPRGVVFEVMETDPKSGWLHVRHADGDDGWCSPKVVWGWLTTVD